MAESTCFYLDPTNLDAYSIVHNPLNQKYKYQHPVTNSWCLRVGFDKPSKNPGLLISSGRIRVLNDVILGGTQYGKIQCYFALHEVTGELLLFDTSKRRTTHLLDGTDGKHWRCDPKQGVVRLHCDRVLLQPNNAQFWLVPPDDDVDYQRRQRLLYARQNPRSDEFVPTLSLLEALSCFDTKHETRVQTLGPRIPGQEIYHIQIRELGRGTFGCVREVVDLRTGNHYAVKIIAHNRFHELGFSSEKTYEEKVKEEVLLHQSLSCVISRP